ncbi:uncharacterized protein LOC129746825 [Uranotaenia lowii]|uniref:uncharacterized protein LOC129746825 n=1 Tax=Uranotaenia lowii TaxID=190385 RepID=UPI0024795DC4|nr:uncharacterized protein LOC129746825 [Uranotaenia lowii]
MEQQVVFKISLAPEDILATRLLLCQVDGCREQFTNESHLRMHLTRRHRIHSENGGGLQTPKNDERPVEHYHCPVESCLYALQSGGEKYFLSFKNLKQHFLKMHSDKNFSCDRCNGQKSFATESLLRAHQSNCGIQHVCQVCQLPYGSREALLTHAKRKGHDYEKVLAAKTSNSKRKMKSTFKIDNSKMSKMSTTVETQTDQNVENLKTIRKSRTTQTELQDEHLSGFFRSECSTQTCTINTFTSTTDNFCQTNFEQFGQFEVPTDLMYPTGTTEPPTSASSNCVCTETQTDLIYDSMFPNEDRTDPMLYSHMYTQTCDDNIFSDLALTTIETQTNWGTEELGEFLVSAETQTGTLAFGNTSSTSTTGTQQSNLPRGETNGDNSRGASTQTQASTSMEFLNAISAESSSIHTQTS